MSSRSSTEVEGGERILVGRVRRPHGVKGAVMVESLTDRPQRFAVGSRLLAGAGSGERLTVESSQPHRGALLVRFEGVADRDAAEALRGTELAVLEREVPEPPEDTWYHFQLVGCRCRDAAAGDLGEVVDVVDDGGGQILLVDDGERRLPVPFVKAFVRRIDVAAREIEVELPPGLVEICG